MSDLLYRKLKAWLIENKYLEMLAPDYFDRWVASLPDPESAVTDVKITAREPDGCGHDSWAPWTAPYVVAHVAEPGKVWYERRRCCRVCHISQVQTWAEDKPDERL